MSNDYPYYKFIKTPDELGMSDKGTLAQMGKDIKGLVSYTELLVSGKSAASKTGKPLGNKYFINTKGKCKGPDGKTQDRYIYINNIPDGSVPIISSGMGVNFSDFKGLIPGVIGNLSSLDPLSLMNSFMAGSTPECQAITMETIDTSNVKGNATHYVAKADIKGINSCSFMNKVNPITKVKCRSGFTNMNAETNTDANLLDQDENKIFSIPKIPDDIAAQAFVTAIGGMGLFILFRTMVKLGLIPSIKE